MSADAPRCGVLSPADVRPRGALTLSAGARARGIALAAAALAWSASGASGAEVWTVASGEVSVRCALTVGGSFDAVTPAVSGTLRWAPASGGRPAAGTLRVRLDSLDTGISLRNTHLRETYLETHRGAAFEEAVLADVRLEAASPIGANRLDSRFTGRLRLHGVERPVAGTARIRRSDGRIRVEAQFALSLEEFAIPPPRYLGVGVRDEVRVSADFVAEVGSTPPEAPT